MAGSTSRFPLRTPLLSAALIALLGACSPDRDAEAPPATDPAPAAQADAATPAGDAGAISPLDGAVGEAKPCNADAIQALVGQEASETVVAQATADSGATSVRVLGPDDAATMDFRIDRLTITTDAAGAIQTLNCG